MATLDIADQFLTECQIGEECVSSVMNMIELEPEPFILEPEIVTCDSKLCEAVANPGPMQGPPLEHLIGREELLSFMFNNQFSPITEMAPVPLPPSVLFLMAAIAVLIWKGRTRNV